MTVTDLPSMPAATAAGVRARRYAGTACTDAQVAAFMAAVGAVRPGTEFSVNLIRRQLDEAFVPTSARSRLFDRAVAAGLIEPVTDIVRGRRQAAYEPSTGRTAKGARVRIYRRTPAPYRPESG
ncbi:hypothetical protein [Puerhibacterium puerhi]|uniref:hypothetical protein n=1 Tax=Puerhibacterium puerhi TaxID=2692623 RepID=UPI00135796D0|nr:hypothetical protein [Puerhibacterium puerhi]